MPARLLVLVLAVVALVGLAAGLYLRTRRAEETSAADRRDEQEQSREATASRFWEALAEARRTLFQGVDGGLFPTAAEWARAKVLYGEAERLDPTASAPKAGLALVQGLRAALEDNSEEMEERLRSADSGDEQTLARYLLGWLQLRQGEPRDAWDQFQMVLEKKPDWLPARLGQAWADVESWEADYACRVFEEALDRWPERGELVVGCARCYDVQSGLGASLEWYAQAFKLGVRSSDVVEGHVSLLLRKGHADEARRSLETLIDAEPFRSDLHLQLGRVLASQDSVTQAVAEYMVALDQDPSSVDARLALGALLLRHHEAGRALSQFEEALALDPEDRDTHVYLGFAQLELGREREAAESFLTGCRSGATLGCREACLRGQHEACTRLSKRARQEVAQTLLERQAAEMSGAGSSFPRTRPPRERTKTRIYVPGGEAVLAPWVGPG